MIKKSTKKRERKSRKFLRKHSVNSIHFKLTWILSTLFFHLNNYVLNLTVDFWRICILFHSIVTLLKILYASTKEDDLKERSKYLTVVFRYRVYTSLSASSSYVLSLLPVYFSLPGMQTVTISCVLLQFGLRPKTTSESNRFEYESMRLFSSPVSVREPRETTERTRYSVRSGPRL